VNGGLSCFSVAGLSANEDTRSKDGDAVAGAVVATAVVVEDTESANDLGVSG
jgi:hypothetical protein